MIAQSTTKTLALRLGIDASPYSGTAWTSRRAEDAPVRIVQELLAVKLPEHFCGMLQLTHTLLPTGTVIPLVILKEGSRVDTLATPGTFSGHTRWKMLHTSSLFSHA
jgi:hypothetical protein